MLFSSRTVERLLNRLYGTKPLLTVLKLNYYRPLNVGCTFQSNYSSSGGWLSKLTTLCKHNLIGSKWDVRVVSRKLSGSPPTNTTLFGLLTVKRNDKKRNVEIINIKNYSSSLESSIFDTKETGFFSIIFFSIIKVSLSTVLYTTEVSIHKDFTSVTGDIILNSRT